MANTTGKFTRGTNRGTKRCYCCGRNTQEGNIDRSTELCLSNPAWEGLGCYDLAGIENEHSDGYHDETPGEDCPVCQPDKFPGYTI